MTTAQPPERATYDVPTFARLLGVSRGYAYEQAKTGAIAGVPVIKVGPTRMVVPRLLADRVLRGEVAPEPVEVA